jgi:Aspartyl protease
LPSRWLLSAILVGAGGAFAVPAADLAPGAAPQAAVAARQTDDQVFASPTRPDHIGRIMVPVMIDGQGPFRFIVDTGASRSTVSPSLAQKLGLRPSAETAIEVNSITGSALVPGVSVAKLQAGDLTIEDTDFPVVWAPLMAGADGILGAAGLTAQKLLVDFHHNRVVISRATHRTTPAGFIRIPAFRLTGGLVAVDTVVAGIRVRAVIDTGSERSLGNLALYAALKERHALGAVSQLTNVYGATPEVVPGNAQTVSTILVNRLRLNEVMLVYGDFHIFKVWKMQDEPALILGMDVLGLLGSMAIDFQHQDFFVGGLPAWGHGTAPVRTIQAAP